MMNKRIEALKKLATKEVWSENQHNGAPEFDGYELDADMFAELIIRECADIALREEHDPYECIKKHFGVES